MSSFYVRAPKRTFSYDSLAAALSMGHICAELDGVPIQVVTWDAGVERVITTVEHQKEAA